MGCGFVGTLTVDLHLQEANSLKDKRKEIQRVKAALVKRVACAIAEVDYHDLHRRTRLTLAVVTREAGDAERLILDASRRLHDDPVFVVLDESRELVAVEAHPSFANGGA